MSKIKPIPITLDTHERKSAVLLHDSPFFTITHELLENDDILHTRSDGRKVLVEVKIGNDICDLPRLKAEVTRMAEIDAELHLIFIQDDYIDPVEPPFHFKVALSECQKAGVFIHHRAKKEHFAALLRKICMGEYTRRNVNVALPEVDIKTKDIPFLVKTMLCVEGITLESAMKVYEDLKLKCTSVHSSKDIIWCEPAMVDLTRELLDCKYDFPHSFDHALGIKKAFDEIDTERKRANYLKLEIHERIAKYRISLVHKLVEAFVPDVLTEELEVKEDEADMESLFPSREKITPETQTHLKANREAWNPSNYDPKNNDREMME